MELTTFTEMFSDKHSLDFTKLKYKYGEENLRQYLETLKKNFYTQLPLLDFQGNPLVILPAKINLRTQQIKALTASPTGEGYSLTAMEDEIIGTLAIEQITSSRDSVRRILHGGAPQEKNEYKAFGIKRGLDFIVDPTNKITEENLFLLYNSAVGDFLEAEDRLKPNAYYRHDTVYVVGQNIEHQGLNPQLLPKYISSLIDYTRQEDELDQIVKSIVLHYYFAYLHPYFDGNGRMARLFQLWYLVQKGYTASLFIPFSIYLNQTKGLYYKAFDSVSTNYKLTELLGGTPFVDVTPFVVYYIEQVINKLPAKATSANALAQYTSLLEKGEITAKEKELFLYVLSAYGTHEFSTKQLEKDFRNAAYATIRSFVLKLESKGVLSSQKYGNRVRYKVKE